MDTLLAQAEPLWLQLQALRPGISVEVLPSCTSTNTLLLDRARRGEASACLLAAQSQTAGRGRNGRPWFAEPEAALTFSLALPLAPADWQGLSLMAGVVLAQALDPAGRHIGLKWPNDLWLRDTAGPGRKLGGILVETVAVAEQRVVVVGVGINVRPLPADADTAAFASGYACVQEFDACASAASTLLRVAPPLLAGLLQFEQQGLAPWRAGFAARDLLAGQPLQLSGAATQQGIGAGIDEHGALLLRDGQGGAALHRVVSGEVSVRLAQVA